MSLAQATPSLWRQRDFLLLWGGQIVSVLGSKVSSTAMPLLVLAITHSPAEAGIVAAAAMLPQLLCQLPAGILVDRVNRRPVLLAADAGRFLVLASIPLGLLLGHLTLVQLVVVSFLDGLGLVLFNLAEFASLPRVVPAALLPAALAQNEAKDRGAVLVGRPLGGLLYSIGRGVPFLADAISYLASFVAVLLIRTDLRVRRERGGNAWHDLVDGARWLWRQPFLRASELLIAVSNMVFQARPLVLVVRAQELHGSDTTIGLMLGISGIGGLAGALLAGRLYRLLPPRLMVIGVNWYWALVEPTVLLIPYPLLLGVVAGASSFVGPLWNVIIGTYYVTLVPDPLRGRVQSVSAAVSWGVQPLGALLGGWLLATSGVTGTVLAMAAVLLITAIAATASPAVRHAPALP
jgi:predicted MFS family arabinose efflux permease